MKRVLPLLIVMLVVLVGCGKVSKFSLTDKYYTNEEKGLVEVELSEVNEAIEAKDNFVLLIYLAGCSTCQELRPIVEEYLDKANIKMLMLSYDSMEKGSKLKKTVKYAPSVVIFKNGKIIDFLDTASDRDIERFSSYDAFSEWFESYIELK